MKKLTAAILGIAATAALAAAPMPASAQKSEDTLRMATTDWWATLDPYFFPLGRGGVLLSQRLRIPAAL